MRLFFFLASLGLVCCSAHAAPSSVPSSGVAPPAPAPVAQSAIVDGFRIGDYVGIARRGLTNLTQLESIIAPTREGQPFKEKAADLLLLTNCKQKIGAVGLIQVSDQFPFTPSTQVAVPPTAAFTFNKISDEAAARVCNDKVASRFPLAQSVAGANWQPLLSVKGRALFVNVPEQAFKPEAKLDFLVFALATPAGIPEKLEYAVDVMRFKGQCGKSFDLYVAGKDPVTLKPGTLFDQAVVQPLCSKEAAKAAGYSLIFNLQ